MLQQLRAQGLLLMLLATEDLSLNRLPQPGFRAMRYERSPCMRTVQYSRGTVGCGAEGLVIILTTLKKLRRGVSSTAVVCHGVIPSTSKSIMLLGSVKCEVNAQNKAVLAKYTALFRV